MDILAGLLDKKQEGYKVSNNYAHINGMLLIVHWIY